jgi:hypothetical protein
VKVLWENESYAVTQEGLALKRLELLIPISALRSAGQAARQLDVEHPEATFIEAVDHAVRLHLPKEFPDGALDPGQRPTRETDKE